jgi:collagenase-like PrtC family protease
MPIIQKKIKFHLPSFAYKGKLNHIFATLLQKEPERFMDNISIGSVYGDFPTSLWNGGRVEVGSCDKGFIEKTIKRFNDMGIPLRFTFTNPLITEEHLADKHSNMLMEMANNGFNEVIVNSPILEKYIREKYPKYPIISSTTKHITDENELRQELAKDYKLVVLDYSMNNKPSFYRTLSAEEKAKIEVLCFEVCKPNCERRILHQNTTGQNCINFVRCKESGEKFEPIPFYCEFGEQNTIYSISSYPHFISPPMVYNNYVRAGITNFKLQGRTADTLVLVDSYVQYMVKPQYKDETRIDVMMILKRHAHEFTDYPTHDTN